MPRRLVSLRPILRSRSPTTASGLEQAQDLAAELGGVSTTSHGVLLQGSRGPRIQKSDSEKRRTHHFATDAEKELLRGDALTHTDIHGRNFLIGAEEAWLVDWEWPTRATPAAMPTCLAVQLVSSGHSPESAESWVSKMVAWEMSSPESLRTVARANARLNRWFAELRADEKWLGAMAEAAEAWADHRAVASSA